ncbi:hypothetical protein BCO_0900021 (plasmid) [Borrelia coriaceae ATCC 43381]|uniref:Uncharacterized protein n=1 Tax=Borrelia coriaceae ATCC 43381 TaxID=1408429 RepID=W5T1D9_9SPIR|nr:hypothetical protein BCO_0900021 [Borrelia coriaceae ATCC 43381]
MFNFDVLLVNLSYKIMNFYKIMGIIIYNIMFDLSVLNLFFMLKS